MYHRIIQKTLQAGRSLRNLSPNNSENVASRPKSSGCITEYFRKRCKQAEVFGKQAEVFGMYHRITQKTLQAGRSLRNLSPNNSENVASRPKSSEFVTE